MTVAGDASAAESEPARAILPRQGTRHSLTEGEVREKNRGISHSPRSASLAGSDRNSYAAYRSAVSRINAIMLGIPCVRFELSCLLRSNGASSALMSVATISDGA